MDIPLLDRLTPSAEQEEAILRIVTEPTRAALNASQTGTGKTLIAVESAIRMGAETVLISAPLHTHEGWAKTIARQTGSIDGIHIINNTHKAGREAKSRLEWGYPGFYLIGRELWRTQDWSGTEVDLMVHDECHTLAQYTNRGSKLARRTQKGWIRAGYTLLQSATPFGGTFKGAWAIGRILYPDLVDSVRLRWEMEWCASVTDWAAVARQKAARAAGSSAAEHMTTSKVVGEAEPGKFVASLPCYIRLTDDAAQKPMEDEIHVPLTKSQRTMYDDFEDKGVAWLGEHPLVADLPIVQRTRLRQITLGECSIREVVKRQRNDDGEMEDVLADEVFFEDDCKSTKLDTLESLLSDLQGEKVLIATDSAKFARVTAKRIGGFAWTGDAKQREREQAKERFVSGDLQYLVATQASISEGLDGLQYGAHIMVVISRNDSDMLNTQMLGRLQRRGQTRRVIVYYITAAGTLDDRQADTLLTKQVAMRQALFAA